MPSALHAIAFGKDSGGGNHFQVRELVAGQ